MDYTVKRFFSRTGMKRLLISVIAAVVPCVLLMKGIYGSFIFSFSIPLLWQVAYRNEPLSSLGIKKDHLFISIGSGIISGLFLGLLGAAALEFFGLTRYAIGGSQKIGITLGAFTVEFALAKELGYQLLSRSGSVKGLLLYGLFSIAVIGLGEELLWRGFIQRKIAGKAAQGAAIWITAVLFSLFHFYLFMILPAPESVILLLLIAAAGVVWGYLYERTDSIWSVAVSHGIAAVFIWKYFFLMPPAG